MDLKLRQGNNTVTVFLPNFCSNFVKNQHYSFHCWDYQMLHHILHSGKVLLGNTFKPVSFETKKIKV